MDLTFLMDFSPINKYTIRPALTMAGYIQNTLDSNDPVANGVNQFNSFPLPDKIQYYFCLKVGTPSYFLAGDFSHSMSSRSLLEALRNKFSSVVRSLESYEPTSKHEYLFKQPFWVRSLQEMDSLKRNELQLVDYYCASVAAIEVYRDNHLSAVRLSEFRQFLQFYTNNSTKFVLQRILGLQSSNIRNAFKEQEKLLDKARAKLPSERDEKWIRQLDEDKWKELRHLGFTPNKTTAKDIHDMAEKAIKLVQIFNAPKLIFEIFDRWFPALLDICHKDVSWWGITDEIFKSADELISIFDNKQANKMMLRQHADFEKLKGECANTESRRREHWGNERKLRELIRRMN